MGAIERGLCLLVGLCRDDNEEVARKLVRKVLTLRLWDDAEDHRSWQRNVMDLDNGGILIISQFTLYGRTEKGAKPDFHEAMGTEAARTLFNKVVEMFRESHPRGRVDTGAFGEIMSVNIVNDGPVTIILDSNHSGKGGMVANKVLCDG